MLNGARNVEKILLPLGLLLILVPLALNERLVAGIFPAYRLPASSGLRIGIFASDALFALAAIVILVRRKPKAKILLDAAVGLGFSLVLLAGIEVAFYYLNLKNRAQLENVVFEFIHDSPDRDVQFAGEHAQAVFQRDDWLGYKPAPNMQVVASRKKAGQLLYRVVYSIDAYGRRVTPLENVASDPHFILFFGGSYTFGEGVNDNETMPYYVSQLAPKYKAYNYGLGGYGPQQMLAKLQSAEITAEITEKQGILVYTFINEHIKRAIGSMRIHDQRGEVMPYYFIDAGGNLIRQGNLVSGRPFLSFVYSILGRSQTLKYFNIDFPLSFRERDLQTTAKIIEEARNVYREKFKSDQFYVIIYPGLGVPELLPYLDAAGITYLDYSDLREAYDQDFWLGEGHPSAKAHRIMAAKLVQDLGLLDEANK